MKIIDNYLEQITTVSDEAKIEKRVNVACGLIMKKGEQGEILLLLIQRAADDHWPLHFEAPRGKCDNGPNEKVIACLKREVKEETGLDIKPIRFIDKFSYIADQGKRESTQYNFLCTMSRPNQEIKLSKEHDDYKWVSSIGEVELMVQPELKKSIVKVFNPDEKIVDYPETELSDEKIKEILDPNDG